jgi:hypothetical protein
MKASAVRQREIGCGTIHESEYYSAGQKRVPFYLGRRGEAKAPPLPSTVAPVAPPKAELLGFLVWRRWRTPAKLFKLAGQNRAGTFRNVRHEFLGAGTFGRLGRFVKRYYAVALTRTARVLLLRRFDASFEGAAVSAHLRRGFPARHRRQR